MPLRLRPLAADERIAVAIPTKNRPSYLAALLASLVSQTVHNWLLVINDSSDPPVEEHAAIHDGNSHFRCSARSTDRAPQ